MRVSGVAEQPAPSLVAVISDLLGRSVESVEVTRSPFSTSHAIDDLVVTDTTGERLFLVRKDVDASGLLPEARGRKPDFIYDPGREMAAYASVLAHAPDGPAQCHGIVDEPADQRRWIFLERLTGIELFQVGDIERWAAAAGWAARLHRTFAGRLDELVGNAPVLVHDRRWHRRWADRALAASERGTIRALRHLHERVDPLVDLLDTYTPTLVHGEFHASNIIVGPPGPAPRVSPIDWEMIAVAPSLADLAALTSGRWSSDARDVIERAYCSEAGRTADDQFAYELDASRLAMCLQWLGWMPGWEPPAEHAFDWLAESLDLIDRLDL